MLNYSTKFLSNISRISYANKYSIFTKFIGKNFAKKDKTMDPNEILKEYYMNQKLNIMKKKQTKTKETEIDYKKIKNDDLVDLLKRYSQHVRDREKKRMNFNRKDRWAQRELDDVMKNFDVQTAKFKDYSKLSKESYIVNVKEFNSVDEIYFYLNEILKDGFLEIHVGMALDVFLKDIQFFKKEDLDTENFKRFVSELSQNVINFIDEKNIYKAAKFLDWYNVSNKNCWYNLERVVSNRKDHISPGIMLKIMDHFAHQNEGSTEFYDLYQFLFWSDHFDGTKNSELISLGYNMFVTRQGYSQFVYDFYNKILPRVSLKDNTFDLLKLIQTFSEISDNYFDIYKKIEDIILSRYEQLELNDVCVIACGYAIAGMGSDMFYRYLEILIMSKFSELDKSGFREVVRAYVVSMNGTPEFFALIKHNIKQHMTLFNITESVYILKCYFERNEGDKEFFEMIEKYIGEKLKDPKEVLLEELCAVADGICYTKVFSREFQKYFELVLSQRMKDITVDPKVSKFLYNSFYSTGMCSVGLMNLFLRAFS